MSSSSRSSTFSSSARLRRAPQISSSASSTRADPQEHERRRDHRVEPVHVLVAAAVEPVGDAEDRGERAHPLDRVGVEQRELVGHARLAAAVPAHDRGEQLDLVGREAAELAVAHEVRAVLVVAAARRRARRCRGGARRTRAARGRRRRGRGARRWRRRGRATSVATWRACGSAQLQRRARLEHRARGGSRAGRRTSRRGRGGATASSTMPSRSAHSLIVSWSKSNSSIAVARTIDPATMRSTRRASRPSMRSRSAAVDASRSLCSARNSLRSMVSWFSVAGVSSSRRAATISASDSSVPLLPDRELGLERRRPRATTGASTSTMCVAQRAAVALGDRVGVHELGAEARHAERHAGGPHAGCWRRRPSPRGCRRRGRSTARARDRAPPTARTAPKIRRASSRPLMTSTCTPVSASDAVDDLAAVRRRAGWRAVALARISVGAGGLGEEAEAAHGGDGLVGRGRRDRRRGGSRRRRGAASPSPARAGRCGRRGARRRRAGGRSSIPRSMAATRIAAHATVARPRGVRRHVGTRGRGDRARARAAGAVPRDGHRRRGARGRAPTHAAMATLGALAADALEVREARW